METKHTPTPWRAECWTSHAPRTVLVDDPGSFTGKRVIAECETDEETAFIITACNTHDQLVAALKQAQARLVFANKHIDCQDDIDAAEAALAAAGIK